MNAKSHENNEKWFLTRFSVLIWTLKARLHWRF